MQYRFIQENSSRFNVEEMCECFELSRSGYYEWRGRKPGLRTREEAAIKTQIQSIHRRAKGRYGHRPIHAHLLEADIACGRDRTLRLMKEMGIEGVQKRGFRPVATDSNHRFGYSANLLKELGRPTGCDQVWVADTTYLQMDKGWCYLATVMDLFSRRIVGWSLSSCNDTALVCAALRCAVMTRGGDIPAGLLHHSDRGSTYASYEYARLLTSFGMGQSMSAKGNCYDNAAMESFYGRYKSSSVREHVFATEDEARANVFEYVEIFYNRFRKHASLGYQTPIQFEEKFCPHGGKAVSLPACINNN